MIHDMAGGTDMAAFIRHENTIQSLESAVAGDGLLIDRVHGLKEQVHKLESKHKALEAELIKAKAEHTSGIVAAVADINGVIGEINAFIRTFLPDVEPVTLENCATTLRDHLATIIGNMMTAFKALDTFLNGYIITDGVRLDRVDAHVPTHVRDVEQKLRATRR